MADFRSRRGWTVGRRPPIAPPPRMIDEEFTPSSGKIDSPESYYLLLDVPGYKKEDIDVSVDESGAIVVKGRRRKGENKQEHFEKTFDVVEDGDNKNITMEFDGETLRVRVPKVAKKANGEDTRTYEASTSTSIPALSSSSPAKEDSFEEPEGPTSDAEEKNKVQSMSPDPSSDIKDTSEEAKSPDSSGDIKDTDEVGKSPDSSSDKAKSPDSSSYTNGITEDKAKIPPSNNDATSSDTKKEPDSSSQAENGKQKEPEIPGKVDTKKKTDDDHSQRKDSLGQDEKSSKTSVMGKIVENKGILLASIISFTLGVLLSQKFHPPPPQ